MRGIMRRSAADIFSFIKATPSREFVLRMSAMEIYNEVCTLERLQASLSVAFQISPSKQYQQ